jgi:signal transduction histidine kinase
MSFVNKKCSIIFFLCILISDVIAQDTVVVNSSFVSMQIGKQCFRRTGNYFKPFQSSSNEWVKIKTLHPKFSLDSTHWLFSIIRNESNSDRTLKLYLNNVQAGLVRLYIVIDGKTDSTLFTGSLLPIKKRASLDRVLAFPIVIPAGKTAEVYIKSWRKLIGITLTPVLEEASSSNYAKAGDYFLIVSIVLLFLILMAAIMLLFYYPSGENLWLLFYMIPSFFYVIAASGFGSLYLWGAWPWFEENGAIFLGNFASAFFIEFSRRALKLNKHYKLINIFSITFSITNATLGLGGFILYGSSKASGAYSALLQLFYLIMLMLLIIIFFITLYKATVLKQKEFWWFVAIFGFYFVFFIVSVFIDIGIMAYDDTMQAFLIPFGVMPQMLMILIFLVRKAITLIKEREIKIAEEMLKGQQSILNERMRMSRELHDEVGATLSGISMYSHLTKEQIKNDQTDEVEKSLNIIQQNAGEMVNKLSDIVWLTNPGQDSMQKLLQRLEEYCTEMAGLKNMKVNLNLPEPMAKIELPAETRRNIYLLFKEAINNAVKYSNATLLELYVKEIDGTIEISLIDNGDGFDIETVNRGNGLNNMEQRAKEMKANCKIKSDKAKETSITVTIKIP